MVWIANYLAQAYSWILVELSSSLAIVYFWISHIIWDVGDVYIIGSGVTFLRDLTMLGWIILLVQPDFSKWWISGIGTGLFIIFNIRYLFSLPFIRYITAFAGEFTL